MTHNPLPETRRYDVIIVGQGLAGSAVAWTYHFAGQRCLLIDPQKAVTSSRIAAGLMTPITGQKFVKTWRLEETWPVAISLYQAVEEQVATRFLTFPDTLRIVDTPEQWELFQKRRQAGEFHGWLAESNPHSLPPGVDPGKGSFGMSPAARLDTIAYLDATRNFFAARGQVIQDTLGPNDSIEVQAEGIFLPRLAVHGKQLVFCQGIEAMSNPWMSDFQFKPAKGEILTVRIPGYDDPAVLHRQAWLARSGPETYRVGSTYDWKDMSESPTEEARRDIVARIEQLVGRSVEVLDQQAAIRPVHRNQYPVVHRLADQPRIGYLNGLGSKGSLYAPWYARHLYELMHAED